MKHRPLIPALLVLPLAISACEPRGGAAAGADAFCAEALARVDSFMASHSGEAESSADERRGGTVVVGVINEIPGGMNSLVSGDYIAHQHHAFVHLMTLVRQDEELRNVPYLARSWTFNDDRTELTFHLRDDVYWHDGERTTAYDVAFSYVRATDPATSFPNAAFWTYFEPGEAGVEVVDSFTVRFGTQPHAEMLDSWRAFAILPRHLLEDVPPAELRNHPFGSRCPVGNGPFRFVEHRQDERWVFAANPAFPAELGGRPHLDRYVFRVIPEPTTLLTELLTENIDVFISPAPDQAAAILDSDATRLINFPSRQYNFVGWNARRPQFSDARVRRAITLATNRRAIVDALLHGYGTVANAGVPPIHWAYDESLDDALPYDPAAARALLDEAGWIDRDGDGIRENDEGVRLEFSIKYNEGNRQRQDVAEIMQAQLRQVGIAVRPQSVEWATLSGQLMSRERDFEGVVIAWVTELKVDDTDLFHSSRIDEAFGFAGLQDERVDRLLDTLQLVVDQDEARPLWHEYQRLLVELQPNTYFYFPDRLIGVNRRLRDVEMDIRGEWANIAGWWIPADRRRPGARAVAP